MRIKIILLGILFIKMKFQINYGNLGGNPMLVLEKGITRLKF